MAKKLTDNKDEFDFSDIIETPNKREEFDFTDIVEPEKKNGAPNFPTSIKEATSTIQTPLAKPSPLVSNLKSTSVTTKPKQVNPFTAPIEEINTAYKEPTNLDLLTQINAKSQERVGVLKNRIGLLGSIKEFQAQVPQIEQDAAQLSAIVQDVRQPLQARQQAQEQLKVYQSQFDKFNQDVEAYKGLVDSEKKIVTDINDYENIRQKGLEKDWGFVKGLSEAIQSSTIKTLGGTAAMFNSLGLSGDPENPDPESNQRVQEEVRANTDKINKFGESLVTQEVPKNFEQIFKGKFSTDKLKYILAQGLGQTAPTVAAGFLGGAGGAAITGAGLGFTESKDIFKKAGLSEKQSDVAALGLAIPLGLLEEWGISDIITKPIGKLIIKETTEDVIKNLAKKEVTNEVLFNTVKKTLGDKLKEYSIDVAKAAWKEPLTEMEQAALSEAAKQGAELYTGKDSNTNQTMSEYLKETGLKIAEEGVYGLAGGAGMSAITSAFQNRTPISAYERALELKNPELLQDFTEQLDEEVASGRLTTEQANIALENVKKIQEVDNKIPSTIKGAGRRSVAAALITKKEQLNQEIEGKDPILSEPIKQQIKEVDNKLLELAENKPIEQITNEPINQAETNITPSSNISNKVSAPSSIEPLTNTENDKENITRLQSNEREGQEPIETKSNETTSGEKTETSGVLQTPKEEVKSNADYKRIENTLYNKWRDLNGKLSKIPKSSNQYELAKKELDAADKELIDFRNSNTDLILEHGTPHDFDKFQLEKIGTGEGHQAFGHGLYFTEDSKIAKSYAEKLSKDKEGIIYQVKIKDGRNKEWLEWRDALDDSQAEKISSIVKSKKSEYDKYLSETQKEEAHTGAAEQLFNENLSVDERPLQVGAVYSDLKDAFGQQEATKIMQDAGFDGVKYKTKGGRGENFNYVIFDPKSIIIENKKVLPTKEVEPPVVEQTTTDVGGVKTPSVSEIDIETQQKDALVNDLSAFNKLTSKAKSSSKGVGALNKIKSKAEALGFTVRENKGKIEVINTNGKKLVKSKTVEEVAEPTPEARDNFKKLFKEGVITPSLVSETLEPTQIRAAIESFKSGKETKDVKRLMNELAELQGDTDVNYREYDQATKSWVNYTVPLSDIVTEEVDVDGLSEKEINELADVYDEMFANIDNETENQITNLFNENQEPEPRQQNKSENSTSSKSSETKSPTSSKGKEKVNPTTQKAVEQILNKEVNEKGELPNSNTTRKNKRETALKEVAESLDAKEKVAVEHIVKNLDLIREKLLNEGLIKTDCAWKPK